MARKSTLRPAAGGRLTSGRSKTGDPACSQAMSTWVRARHQGVAVAAAVFKVLGQCRAKARAQKMAASHATAGNVAKSQVWAKRAQLGMSGAERDRTAALRRVELEGRRAERAARRPAYSREALIRAGQAAADREADVFSRIARDLPAGGRPRREGRGTADGLERAQILRAKRAAARAPKAAPKEGGFSLKQESAIGKKSFKVADLGKGRTGTLFDMKKGDLKGQTSLLDRVGSRESNPRARRYERLGARSLELQDELGRARSKRARELVDRRREGRARAEDAAAVARRGAPGRPALRAEGRGTAERAEKAKALAAHRRHLNNARNELRHFDEKWQGRAHPTDESRRDRLDELAGIRRQIARTRGKPVPGRPAAAAPSRAEKVKATAAAHGVTVARLSGGRESVGRISPELREARLREKLATRGRTAARLREARAMKNEHEHPEAHGKPDTPYQLGTRHIHFDPERFQYKLGAQGVHGTTDALKDVQAWNPKLAGIVSVWRDPANGRTYVVNGHHRVDLAKRLGVDKIKVQYLDSPNAQHARGEGALMNIAEGRGTALDAAKFFRDHGMTPDQARGHGVSLKEHTAKQGLAMAQLEPGLFKRTVNGELSHNRAAIVGAAGLSHDEQRGLMKLLDKPRYRNVTDGTVRNLAQMAKDAGTKAVKTRDLFGEGEEHESLAVHRASLEDKIKRKLGGDERLFGLVSKSKSAKELAERADSNIDTEKAGAVGLEARQLHHFFDDLKRRTGPLSRSLNEGAERLHAGEKADKVFHEHYRKARETLKAMLEADRLD